MNYLETVLYFNELRQKALEEELTPYGRTVADELKDAFNTMYESLVPEENGSPSKRRSRKPKQRNRRQRKPADASVCSISVRTVRTATSSVNCSSLSTQQPIATGCMSVES